MPTNKADDSQPIEESSQEEITASEAGQPEVAETAQGEEQATPATSQEDESEGPTGSSIDDDPRFQVRWKKKEQARADARSDLGSVPNLGPDRVADLERQLAEEKARAQDLHDKWQRTAADLVNLRRRTEQDKEDLEKFASMRLVQDLLPVLDNFERALTTIPGNLAMLSWIQGVMLMERQFRAMLEMRGVAPIEAQGQPFSPYYHEAVMERETTEAAPGTVVQELQKGYTMHGTVLRPTLVEIARAPDEPVAATEPETTESSETDTITEDAASQNVGP
jgi:molecular chaperone GrpE